MDQWIARRMEEAGEREAQAVHLDVDELEEKTV